MQNAEKGSIHTTIASTFKRRNKNNKQTMALAK